MSKKFVAILCAVSFFVGFLFHGDMFNNKTEEEIMTQMEDSYQSGYDDGYEVGADEGYAEGYACGWEDAKADFG